MNDVNSLSHTSWNCKYHVVFAPKYRRKVFFGEKRREIGSILRTLCNWKGNKIIEAEVCADHPHADRDTAKDSSSKFHGVGERKKQPDAVREVPGAKIEIPEPGILVPWVLCGHGREKCKEDTGVHPMSVRAGQSRRAADHAKLLKCPFTGGK